jgi:EAL domain-containing protein (putative c-di-GMP-specific phosphodiesterase class I)
MDIKVDVNNAEITKAIIAMAHSLSLKVIAEGVETLEQLEFLKAHNCDYLQGFLFSRPVPAEDMTRILQDGTHIIING